MTVMPEESPIDRYEHALNIAKIVLWARKVIVLDMPDVDGLGSVGTIAPTIHTEVTSGGRTREGKAPAHATLEAALSPADPDQLLREEESLLPALAEVVDEEKTRRVHDRRNAAREARESTAEVKDAEQREVELRERVRRTGRRADASAFLNRYERLFARPSRLSARMRPRLEIAIESVGVGRAVALMEERHAGGADPKSAAYFVPVLEEVVNGAAAR